MKLEFLARAMLIILGWLAPFGTVLYLLWYYRMGWTPAMKLDPQEAVLLVFAACLVGVACTVQAFGEENKQ